jgi:hypothetical protein
MAVLMKINMTRRMKKFTFLMLVLLVNYAAYSQSEYGILVKTTLFPFKGWYGSHAGVQRITVGSKTINKTSNPELTFKIEYDYISIDDQPSTIQCTSRTSGNYDNTDCGPITKNILYNKATFIQSTFNGCIADSEIYSIHVTSTDTMKSKCPEDVIELNNGWNWQYSFDGAKWEDFAANFQEQRSIFFKINELAGFENKTKVYFRAGFGTQFTNILPCDIIPCSPNVIEPIEPKNTSCAYNNDGIVSLTFDRSLIKDESFSFSFIQNNVPIITPFYSVDAATNKKYTFSGLAAGNYYIKYQTFIGSQPTSVNKEPYPSFTINPAIPLTFELQNPKNPSCFGAEDGSVEVLITRGIPKFFEVDGDSVIPDELGPNLYRINNLKAKPDGHKIKVTDANNCIDNGKYD